MLTDKEKKFVETQRKHGKYFLAGSILLFFFAIVLIYMVKNFNFNITEICGTCTIPPEIRECIANKLFRCIAKFSIIVGFAGGLCLGFLLCLPISISLYISNRKWLKIVDKFNLP